MFNVIIRIMLILWYVVAVMDVTDCIELHFLQLKLHQNPDQFQITMVLTSHMIYFGSAYLPIKCKTWLQ